MNEMAFITIQPIQSIMTPMFLIKQPPATAMAKKKKATKFSMNIELCYS